MKEQPQKDFISINEYLDSINDGLKTYSNRVIGEVTEIQMYPGRSYLFFKIKDGDKDNPAVLTCMMWKNDYDISGVEMKIGLEIIVAGFPGIYKPYGRFTFNTKTVELVGEGALKIQYDKLKAQLEKEGLFNVSKKRPLPFLPQKIGLITSKDGAVISDFQVNLGKFGFKISFIDSRVEGQLATQELLGSIRTFKDKDIEVLVLMRGGGSLESLLPFNNEVLVREIASFPVPVIVGVGHEKDIPLVALVADKMVSTPTAVAHTLNDTWQKAVQKLDLDKEKIFSLFKNSLFDNQKNVSRSFEVMKKNFQLIFDNFDKMEESLQRSLISIKSKISEIKRNIADYPRIIDVHMRSSIKKLSEKISLKDTVFMFKNLLGQTKNNLLSAEKLLIKSSPEEQLRLGYSIIQSGGVLIRKISQIKEGQIVSARVEDGTFESEVKIINN